MNIEYLPITLDRNGVFHVEPLDITINGHIISNSIHKLNKHSGGGTVTVDSLIDKHVK